MATAIHIKKNEYIIVGDVSLFFMRFTDSSCHIFARNPEEAVTRIGSDYPEKIILDIHRSVAGHNFEIEDIEDVDTSEIQWHEFAEIKLIGQNDTAQQNMHLTSGSLRGLWASFWLWVSSVLKHFTSPPTGR